MPRDLIKHLLGTSARSRRGTSGSPPRPDFRVEGLEHRTVPAANFAPIGGRAGAALQPITFTLSATDADPTDALTFSAANLPAGATLDPTTGAFGWTPALLQTGTFAVAFAVSDGKATDSETVTFTISGTNVAPAITSDAGGATAAVSVAENTTAVTTVTAADPNPGAALTYTIAGGADAGLFTIDPATGVLTFTSPSSAGTYLVTAQVTDDGTGALTSSQDLTVVVA